MAQSLCFLLRAVGNALITEIIIAKYSTDVMRHTIKAGDKLTGDDCAYLIGEVRKGVMLCPHGRPISLIISKHEFEKMFKRVL